MIGQDMDTATEGLVQTPRTTGGSRLPGALETGTDGCAAPERERGVDLALPRPPLGVGHEAGAQVEVDASHGPRVGQGVVLRRRAAVRSLRV